MATPSLRRCGVCRSGTLTITARALRKSPQELLELPTIEDIVAYCVALGADQVGGPLSILEQGQIAWSAGTEVTDQHVASLRAAILSHEDPLGEALNALRTPVARRAQGAISTPTNIVSSMVSWVLQQGASAVVDAGCGSGRFALDAARKAAEDKQIVAIDSDPVATLICRAGAAVLGCKSILVLHDDYLTCDIPLFRSPVGYVGNPPYVRHHGIGPEQKHWGRDAAKQLGLSWSGLSGLHVLFLVATALRMRPNDVGCFITSAEWLDVGYGQVLRSMFSDQPRLQSIHLLDPRASAFSDAMTTSVIVCVEQEAANEGVTARTVADPIDLADLRQPGRTVQRTQLQCSPRWTPILLNRGLAGRENDGLVSLGSYVRVSRGVATGANDYFVLRKEEMLARGLGDFARPVVTSAEEVFQSRGMLRMRPDTRYVLDVPGALGANAFAHPGLDRFLREGESRGIPGRYLCRQRKFWWVLAPRTPPIVATYMARRPPAFVLNPDGMAILNTCHGLYPKVHLTAVQLRGLVGYLNSLGSELSGVGRTYHGGLQKFEPREMEAIRVPPAGHLAEFVADKT